MLVVRTSYTLHVQRRAVTAKMAVIVTAVIFAIYAKPNRCPSGLASRFFNFVVEKNNYQNSGYLHSGCSKFLKYIILLAFELAQIRM